MKKLSKTQIRKKANKIKTLLNHELFEHFVYSNRGHLHNDIVIRALNLNSLDEVKDILLQHLHHQSRLSGDIHPYLAKYYY